MFRIPVHREHWFLEGRTYKKRNRIGGENLIVNWAGGIHRTIDRVVREIQENLGKCSIIHKHLKCEMFNECAIPSACLALPLPSPLPLFRSQVRHLLP